jgi:hypothetical protein
LERLPRRAREAYLWCRRRWTAQRFGRTVAPVLRRLCQRRYAIGCRHSWRRRTHRVLGGQLNQRLPRGRIVAGRYLPPLNPRLPRGAAASLATSVASVTAGRFVDTLWRCRTWQLSRAKRRAKRDGIGPGRHDLHAAFGVPENWESAVQ